MGHQRPLRHTTLRPSALTNIYISSPTNFHLGFALSAVNPTQLRSLFMYLRKGLTHREILNCSFLHERDGILEQTPLI